jgi:phosphoglycolate phosphatase-like HAD superfamily hydrolase
VRKRTIVLDLDGTLIDVAKRHYAVYRDVLTAIGGRAIPFSRYWELKRADTGWPDILRASALRGRDAPAFLTQFRERIEEPSYLALDAPFTFTHSVIDALSAHDVYLVTLRRSPDALRKQLDRLDLVRQFTAVVSDADHNAAQRTKTELIGTIVREPEAIVVGDTEEDIAAAHEVDAVAIAVASGVRSESVLRRSEPDHLVEDIRFLPELLCR